MAILEGDDRDIVRRYFEDKLTAPVRIVVFTDNEDDASVRGVQTGASSRQAQELAEDLASLSDQIRLEVHDITEQAQLAKAWGILAAPTIAVGAAGDDPPRARYVGYPDGHEFPSLLQTLASAVDEQWGLLPETVELLQKVDRPIDLKTFVTPT